MDTSRRVKFLLGSLAVLCAVWIDGASAETFIVGGEKGWVVPDSSTNDVNYTVWAQNVTARVGDALYFKYSPTAHNVLKVNATTYSACGTSDYLGTWDTGDTTVYLQEEGMQYFICGAPSHCRWGQAFALGVTSPKTNDASPGQNTSAPNVLSPPGSPAAAPLAARSLATVGVVSLLSLGFLLMGSASSFLLGA